MNQIEIDMSLEESKTQIRTAIYQRWIENHPNYSKTDAYYRRDREGQTIVFRLRSGHNRLKKTHAYKIQNWYKPQLSMWQHRSKS